MDHVGPGLTQLNEQLLAELDRLDRTLAPILSRAAAPRSRASSGAAGAAAEEPAATPPAKAEEEPAEVDAAAALRGAKLFLSAALQLLEDKREQDGIVRRAAFPSAGAILTGYLKKSKTDSGAIGLWTSKFAAVAYGSFTYCEGGGRGAAPEAQARKQKTLRLSPHDCVCRPVDAGGRRHGATAFELVVAGKRRLWLAKSEAERAQWVSAINRGIRGPEALAEQAGLSAASSPLLYERDLQLFVAVRAQIQRATTRAEYALALEQATASELCVPVAWVRTRLEVPARDDCAIGQVLKDLARDRVAINGREYSGARQGPEAVIAALTACLLDFGCRRRDHAMTEAEALSFARQVLLASNRTQSGGDSYDTIDLLCRNDQVVLCPLSTQADPLQIDVSIVSGGMLGNGGLVSVSADTAAGGPAAPADDANEQYVLVRAQVTSSYRVCSADPSGDPAEDTWATVDVTFQQAFSLVASMGGTAGEGMVRVMASS